MKKHRITGLIGTLVLHVLVLVFLLLVAISKPKMQEEGGVPVMLGNMEVAQGNADPYTLTDVDVLDEPQLPTETTVPEPVPETPVKSDMITQEDEPTIAVPKKETPKPTPKTEKVKKKPVQKEPVKPKEKTEAEKKAEAEKLAAEKKAAEQKAAAEAAAKKLLVLSERERKQEVKELVRQVTVYKVARLGILLKVSLLEWVDMEVGI